MIITSIEELGVRKWDILIPLTGLGDIAYFTRIATEMKKLGKSTIFITDIEYIKDNFPNDDYLLYLDASKLNSLSNNDIQRISSYIKETYNVNDLDIFSLTENSYSGMSLSKQYLRKKVLYEFQEIEKIFSIISCDYVLYNIGGEILKRSIHQVSKKKGIQVIMYGPSPIRQNTIFFTDDESMRWPHLELSPLSSLSKERIDAARDFIKTFREARPFLDTYPNIFRGERFSSLFNLTYLSDRMNHLQRMKWKFSKKALAALAWEKFTRVIKAKIVLSLFTNSLAMSKDILDDTDNLVFFPLQLSAESRIGVRAPQFLDQSVAVELISRNLPPGFKLVVKEHPSWVGFLKLGTLYRISKMQNVLLVHPSINSHDIIRKSKIVTVINGTIGYEAILYGKPVIVLASEYYVGYGLSIDVNDYSKIGNAIDTALQWNQDEELLIRFVDGVLNSLKPGTRCCEGFDENMIPITASSIYEFMEWCKANRHKMMFPMDQRFEG